MMADHILPNAMLGILGGGQLGRMFTMAARAMGYRVTVLDPDPDSPAGGLADVHICSKYDDPGALQMLVDTCAAVTTEFENVPAESMRFLQSRMRVSPSAECVSVAQDRIKEKRYISNAGLGVAPFLALENADDLARDMAGHLPGILKIARLGYDGKGQIRVKTADEVKAAWEQMGGKPCVLEKMLDLKTEISVIVTRSSAEEVNTFPVAENQHESGILDISIVPARVADEIAAKARQMALQLAQALDYIGVLAVEFFVLQDNSLLINEIAPRPHNSGHYSIDACVTSQFEQQVRTLCGLPLGSTALLSSAVMVNLLGDVWRNGDPDWNIVLQHPSAKLHLYGKAEARPGRKMGHFTMLCSDTAAALNEALRIKKQLEAN